VGVEVVGVKGTIFNPNHGQESKKEEKSRGILPTED
jgi:hypothetical protein